MVRETHPTLIFLVLGNTREYEWLVAKLHLETTAGGEDGGVQVKSYPRLLRFQHHF